MVPTPARGGDFYAHSYVWLNNAALIYTPSRASTRRTWLLFLRARGRPGGEHRRRVRDGRCDVRACACVVGVVDHDPFDLAARPIPVSANATSPLVSASFDVVRAARISRTRAERRDSRSCVVSRSSRSERTIRISCRTPASRDLSTSTSTTHDIDAKMFASHTSTLSHHDNRARDDHDSYALPTPSPYV